MKVVRWLPAALIGALLSHHPAPSSAAATPAADADGAAAPGEAKLRGAGEGRERSGAGRGGSPAAAAAIALQAPASEEEEEEEDRGLTVCDPYYCPLVTTLQPHIHLCSENTFLQPAAIFQGSCEGYYYAALDPGVSEVCVFDEPTVIVLAHAQWCLGLTRGVTFDLLKDGVRIRRFTETLGPFAVFGDTPPTPGVSKAVNSRVLEAGSTYTLTVTMKDRGGCVNLKQSYQFTIRGDCQSNDDYYDDAPPADDGDDYNYDDYYN